MTMKLAEFFLMSEARVTVEIDVDSVNPDAGGWDALEDEADRLGVIWTTDEDRFGNSIYRLSGERDAIDSLWTKFYKPYKSRFVHKSNIEDPAGGFDHDSPEWER